MQTEMNHQSVQVYYEFIYLKYHKDIDYDLWLMEYSSKFVDIFLFTFF